MGLDIFINTDNYEQLHADRYNDEGYFNNHNLSRTFCNFMCRQNVIHHEPELDQIGKIAVVDIQPIYEMETYPDEIGLEFRLENTENEIEKQYFLNQAEEDKRKLNGNIDKILIMVSDLISKLNVIDNLPELLHPTDFDTLGSNEYFSDFQIDKADSYVGNNFGQDLRNFRRFLEFAKANGSTTVWFSYG